MKSIIVTACIDERFAAATSRRRPVFADAGAADYVPAAAPARPRSPI